MDTLKVFKYTIGEGWHVKIVVSNWNSFTFHDIQSPKDATPDDVESFLADAENAVVAKMSDIEESKYGS
jgi:hypothetical protein